MSESDYPRRASAEVASGEGPKVRLLEAREVSIPIAVTPAGGGEEMPPEIMRLRADFLAGKELSREQMGELMRQAAESSGGGGNSNCNIC